MPAFTELPGQLSETDLEVAAIVLAAGGSTRILTANKLLLPIGTKPMVAATFDTVAAAGFSPIVVVIGHEERALRDALGNREARFITNPDWKEGLASSLKAGVAALPTTAAGALIVLADMPLLQETTLQTLKDRFTAGDGAQIVYPTYKGRQGNPVLFPARFFADILNLQGDRGARELLKKYAPDVVAVPIKSREVLLDCDTEEDYNRMLALLKE